MNEYQTHIEIEPKVHLIRGLNRSKFPEANSLLINDEILTLIDAGSNLLQIESTLNDLGYQIEDLDRIILTHYHIDHKGYAAVLYAKSDCEVLCHPLAENGIRTFEGMADCYGIRTHRYYETWKSFLGEWLPHITAKYEVTGYIKNEVPLTCGDVDLIPLHTPGHTHDHTIFGINGFETVFLVDIDLTRFGPWYGNAVSDIQSFKESIRQIMSLEPKVGISSHLINPVTENLHVRLSTFLSAFDIRERRILDNISKGADTIEKLAQIPTIYPTIPYQAYYVFEEFMLEKHIELLMDRDMLIEEKGSYQILEG